MYKFQINYIEKVTKFTIFGKKDFILIGFISGLKSWTN